MGPQLFLHAAWLLTCVFSSATCLTTHGSGRPATRRAPLAPTENTLRLQVGLATKVNSVWSQVTTESILDPIVVALTPTQHEKHPCIVQVKDVKVGSFWIRCIEPSNLRADDHNDEQVAWMVISRGLHKIGGMVIEAGTTTVTGSNELDSANRRTRAVAANSPWLQLAFAAPFESHPIVFTQKLVEINSCGLSQLQTLTFGEKTILHTRNRLVSKFSFMTALENEESRRSPLDYDKRETLGWVAMAETSEAVATASGFMHTQLVDGVTEKDTPIDFGRALDPAHGQFDKVPLIFGSLQTFNEADPAWVRVRKIDHGHVFKIYIEEDTTMDAETAHINETVALLLVSQAVAIPTQYQPRKASCNPKDLPAPVNGHATCKMQRGIYTCEFRCDEGFYADGSLSSACLLNTGTWSDPAPKCLKDKEETATIQFGEATNVNFEWRKVETAWIKRPVVFASAATANSPDPCVVQVRNVISGSFEIRCKAPIDDRDDSRLSDESVSWMVVAEGLHLTPGGLYFQAGTHTVSGAAEITQTNRGTFQTIEFHHTFNDVPILFTQVQAVEHALLTAIHTQVQAVNPSQFSVALENEALYETYMSTEDTQTIGWIAVQNMKHQHLHEEMPVTGGKAHIMMHNQLLVGLLPQPVVFHNSEDTTDFTKPPLFLISQQDTYNREPNWLRRGNATAESVDVWVELSHSVVESGLHAPEPVGYLAVSDAFTMNTRNITCHHEPVPGGIMGMTMPDYTCFPPQLYPGSICTYDCQDRGVLGGAKERVCDADGHWDVDMPRCYDNCREEPIVPDGFVNCTGTEHKDECVVTCKPGFQLFGEDSVKCVGQNWTDLPSCRALDRVTVQFGLAPLVDHEWITVTTSKIWDPIVVATLPSSNDPDPCVPMIRNVVKGSFDLRCKEPSNLNQVRIKNESISWMVVERGVHTTPGGHTIEANRRVFVGGQFKISPPFMFESNNFGGGAVVMAQLQTLDPDHDEFLHARVQSVRTNGFQFSLEHDEATAISWEKHPDEVIGWVAIDTGVKQETLEKNTLRVIRSAVSIRPSPSSVPYANTYAQPPLVLGQLQSMHTYGNAWMRAKSIDRAQASLYIAGDTTLTDVTRDKYEEGGLFVVEGPLVLRTNIQGCFPNDAWSAERYTCDQDIGHNGMYPLGTTCTLYCKDGMLPRLCDKLAGGWSGLDCKGAPAPNIKTSDDEDEGGFFSALAGWTWHLIVAGVSMAVLLFLILAAVFIYRRRAWVKEKFQRRANRSAYLNVSDHDLELEERMDGENGLMDEGSDGSDQEDFVNGSDVGMYTDNRPNFRELVDDDEPMIRP